MAINFNGNTYSGEVLEDLLAYTAQGNDTFKEGLIHIVPGIQKRKVLPHVSLNNIIQDNVPTPTTQGAATAQQNQYTFSERALEPQDFMVYLEFNPRDFEEYWRPFQPEGPLLFRELDPKVQATMLRLLIDKKDQWFNDCIWSGQKGGALSSDTVGSITTTIEGATVIGGATTGGNMKYFDGFLARALVNDAAAEGSEERASGKVILSGNTVLDSGEKIEAALYAMYSKCPKALRKSDKLKFVMGWDLWDIYDQYLSSKDTKYTENADVNKFRFKGKRVVVINGMPENTIALGKFTSGADSCLWMGVDYSTDLESVKVEPLQANSELYFFQMRMKADVNIVLPSEIIVHTAYTRKNS